MRYSRIGRLTTGQNHARGAQRLPPRGPKQVSEQERRTLSGLHSLPTKLVANPETREIVTCAALVAQSARLALESAARVPWIDAEDRLVSDGGRHMAGWRGRRARDVEAFLELEARQLRPRTRLSGG